MQMQTMFNTLLKQIAKPMGLRFTIACLPLVLFGLSSICSSRLAAETSKIVWVEVESLQNKGDWVVDQQFMDIMGSPYLLAHGLGEPVPDASGEVSTSNPGEYRVWVRNRNWVAPWNVKEAPGKFQVLIDNRR